jgi:hypothetical protein
MSFFMLFCWGIEDAMQDEFNDLLARKRQQIPAIPLQE